MRKAIVIGLQMLVLSICMACAYNTMPHMSKEEVLTALYNRQTIGIISKSHYDDTLHIYYMNYGGDTLIIRDIISQVNIAIEFESFLDIVSYSKHIYSAVLYDTDELVDYEYDITIIEAQYTELYKYYNWIIGDKAIDTYTIDDYYAKYVKYAIDTNDIMVSLKEYTKYASYWIDIIPSIYVYAIVNESLKNRIPVSYLYAIIYHESGNFQYLTSIASNSNGSIDYGLMGLNSANFDTATIYGRQFLENMFYYDNEYTEFDYTNQLHILKVCTKYLQGLIIEYGYKNALIHYNGGSSQFTHQRLKAESIQYASKVLSIYKRHVWRDKAIKSFDASIYAYLLQYEESLKIPALSNIIYEPEKITHELEYTLYTTRIQIYQRVFEYEVQYPYRKRYN